MSFQASLLKLHMLGSLLQIVNLVLSLTTHSIVTFLVLGPWLTLRRLRRPQRLPFKLKRTVSWLFNQPVHCPLQVLSLEHNFYPVCLNIHSKCFPDIERISNPMVSFAGLILVRLSRLFHATTCAVFLSFGVFKLSFCIFKLSF